jgi:hypothetical protein
MKEKSIKKLKDWKQKRKLGLVGQPAKPMTWVT